MRHDEWRLECKEWLHGRGLHRWEKAGENCSVTLLGERERTWMGGSRMQKVVGLREGMECSTVVGSRDI
jgi:hypothetical protein